MIKGAIFDLDGVIVDTAKYHYLAWQRLARELGFVFTEADNERLKGVSRVASLEILLEVGGLSGKFSDREKERMATRKNEWYVDYISKLTPDEILPGVLRFLDEVKQAGVHSAIGSASKNTPLILDRLRLSEYFDAVVDGNMVSAAKPDPEVFVKGAQLIGCEPASCVVFEDAAAGIEAARRGGMRSVGIGSPEVLALADLVIPGFEKITWDEIVKQLTDE